MITENSASLMIELQYLKSVCQFILSFAFQKAEAND